MYLLQISKKPSCKIEVYSAKTMYTQVQKPDVRWQKILSDLAHTRFFIQSSHKIQKYLMCSFSQRFHQIVTVRCQQKSYKIQTLRSAQYQTELFLSDIIRHKRFESKEIPSSYTTDFVFVCQLNFESNSMLRSNGKYLIFFFEYYESNFLYS